MWSIAIVALSLALAATAAAREHEGRGGDNGNSGNNGPPADTPAARPPDPEPAPEPEPAPAAEPAPAPAPEPAADPAADPAPSPAGNSAQAPGHDPAGPGNSENAPGHNPAGPGNSENAGTPSSAGAPADGDADPRAAEANGGRADPPGGAPDALGRSGEHGRPETRGAPDERGPPDERGAPGERGPPDERANGRFANESASNETRGRGKSGDAPGQNKTRDERGRGRSDEAPGRGDDGPVGPAPGANAQAFEGGPGGVPAIALERASVPEENTRSALVRVQRANESVDVAQGEVTISGEGVENLTQAVLVVIHPNGTEEIIAEGASEAPWNTTRYENGYYTVEVRERASSGQMMTVASTSVLVENPRAEAIAAVAAVATGAVVSAGAGALAARGFDLLGLLKGAVGEASADAASELAEDKLRVKTASIGVVRWRTRSTLLLLMVAGLLAFFKAFGARDDLLLTLPIAFLAAFVYTVGDYTAEWALARSSGAQAQFKLWTPGALSLAISSIFFRSPFGYPGYVSETDVGRHGEGARLRTRAGLRALAFMGASLALTIPFLLAGAVWRWDVAEYGIGVALMMAAAGAMPFSPMPGRDVWQWRKLAWCGAFLVLATLYLTWQLAMLPLMVLISVAGVGAAGFVAALRWLRRGA